MHIAARGAGVCQACRACVLTCACEQLTMRSPLPSLTFLGSPQTQMPLVSVSRVWPTPKPTSAGPQHSRERGACWTLLAHVTCAALSRDGCCMCRRLLHPHNALTAGHSKQLVEQEAFAGSVGPDHHHGGYRAVDAFQELQALRCDCEMGGAGNGVDQRVWSGLPGSCADWDDAAAHQQQEHPRHGAVSCTASCCCHQRRVVLLPGCG